MSSIEPSNSLSWRVTVLEREVERLKEGKPEVVAERVGMLALRVTELKLEIEKDMAGLRDQIKDFRRIFVSVFLGLGVTVAASVVALVITGGTP